MKVKAARPFLSTYHGNVEKGQEIECSDGQAEQWLELGMIEEYETKVVAPKPKIGPKKADK